MFGEGGLGTFLGAEAGGFAAGHIGQTLLQNRFGPVQEAVLARVRQAIDDPKIAYDLTRPVGTKISDATKQWLRSLLVTVPVSQAARTLSPEPAQ